MRYLSRHTLARGAVFGGMMALAAGFAPAAAASPSVPCSTTALARAISGAASGETLVLASGCTYQVSDALPGIAANLTIDGREATLDGDGRESAGYSLLGVPAGVTLHVRNLNFTCSGNYVEQCGQAIGSSGNVTIDGGTFYDLGPTYNEYGLTDGGAISNGGQLAVIGATFDDNFTEGSGGAISNNGQLAVIATRFSHNGARSMYGSGGAIYNNGTLTVASSTFSGNTGEGGAISNDGQATLRQDTLSGNSTFFAFTSGGAIYNTGTLTVASSALNNNVASYTGGAIYSYGQATLRQDTMSGNSASDGGAIYNVSALTASSTAITGNTAAAGSPGGIDNAGGAVSLHRDHIGSNTPFNCTNVPGCTG